MDACLPLHTPPPAHTNTALGISTTLDRGHQGKIIKYGIQDKISHDFHFGEDNYQATCIALKEKNAYSALPIVLAKFLFLPFFSIGSI